MSAQRKPDIAERYQWLVDRLKVEFPDKVRSMTGDMGCLFAVGYLSGKKQRAVRVEYYAGIPPNVRYYSLNDDPDKEAAVERIIAAFRETEKEGANAL